MIVTSGGIGGNHDLVRRHWPKRLGEPPRHMISGVPEHVDGLMLDVVKGKRRQHHQFRPHVALPGRHPELRADLEPARHPDPERARRRSGSMRAGKRLPVPLFPGFDSLGALAHITREGTTIRGSC